MCFWKDGRDFFEVGVEQNVVDYEFNSDWLNEFGWDFYKWNQSVQFVDPKIRVDDIWNEPQLKKLVSS